jgi:hypothetical protein
MELEGANLMAFDGLAKVGTAVRYLYSLWSLFITVGLFLFVVAIFKRPLEFGVIPFRLILAGFGLRLWQDSVAKGLKRLCALVFLVASILPSRYFLMVYSYLR